MRFHESVLSRQVKIDIGNNFCFWQFVNIGLFLLAPTTPPIEVSNPDSRPDSSTGGLEQGTERVKKGEVDRVKVQSIN